MPRTELPAILPASGRLGAFVFSGRVIGAGACAKIYHATHEPSGRDVAVKVLDRRWIGGALPLEVRVHQAVTASGHPHLVRFLAHSRVRDPEGDVHCLVMEACHGGDVFSLLEAVGPLPEEHSLHIFAGAVSGVMHMHSLGVAHRDLKPENLLLSGADQRPGGEGEGEQPPLTIKVCDLGLAAHLEASQDRQGTWAYWAPECFTATRGSGREVDMWSLGVILYIVLSGSHPFDAPGRTDAQMRKAIQQGRVEFPSPQWDGVSGEAIDLIERLLQADPRSRLDAPSLLRHPWVVGRNLSTTPLLESGRRLQEYQRAAAKWKATLLSSMVQQAAVRRRGSANTTAMHASGEGADGVEQGGEQEATSVRELLSAAFTAYDPNGKGYVLAQDLERVLAHTTGGGFSQEEMSQIVRSIHGRRTSSGGAGCGGEGKESRIYYDDFLSLASHTVREQSRFFEAGDVIFRTGDEPDFMYLILEGRVRRTTPPTTRGASPAQWLQREQYLSPGDYFGSSALLGSRTRHSTMTAETDVLLATVGRDDFEAMTSAALRSAESNARAPQLLPSQLRLEMRQSQSAQRQQQQRRHTSASAVGDGSDGCGGAAVASAGLGGSGAGSGSHRGDTAGGEAGRGGCPAGDTAATATAPSSSERGGGGAGGVSSPASEGAPLRFRGSSLPLPDDERKRRQLERSLRFILLMASSEPPREMRSGDVLFREGDEADHMYIIRSGTLLSSMLGVDGRRRDIGTRVRGECCGETACLSRAPFNTTVTCCSERCEVVSVPRDAFLEMIRSSWGVCEQLLQVSEEHARKRMRRRHFRRTQEEVGDVGADEEDEVALDLRRRERRSSF
mmetsp:Transcript_22747/g.66940  ORF Transcript_22747/g.66940 Transcript_22747/m.66940 type:complete len:843 (+) Transcript_22747:76-2604(+)